ncbi:MAG: hypothetical protein JOZ42_04220 [Acetobacteraceae bacterium]|nr:hypothetical protein [Acetobacteraceae bacterium]
MSKIVRGRILFAQEGRFMLRTESGTGQLFVLSHDAGVEPQQLPPLQHAQAEVEVEFDETPGGLSAVARAIRVPDDDLAGKAEAV